MSTDLVIFVPSPDQLEEAGKISKGWAAFGNKLALLKHELAFKVQQQKPALPTKVEDITSADATLATLKKAYKDLQDQRKATTGKLDDVTKTLMLPEKELADYITKYEAALLPLKQVKRNQDAAAAAKAQELQRYRENIQIQYNELCSNCEKTITKVKADKFEFALKNVHVVDIDKYVVRLQTEAAPAMFGYNPITSTDPEKQAIITEIFSLFNPDTYVAKYKSELPALFVDFAIAKSNQAEAILNISAKTEAAVKDIDTATEMNNVAASLDAASYSAPPIIATKGLKQQWVIDMDHTETNMVNIMRAFVGNMVNAMPQLRVSDCFNVTINQMGSALAALKNLDDKFSPDKITFKLTDKL